MCPGNSTRSRSSIWTKTNWNKSWSLTARCRKRKTARRRGRKNRNRGCPPCHCGKVRASGSSDPRNGGDPDRLYYGRKAYPGDQKCSDRDTLEQVTEKSDELAKRRKTFQRSVLLQVQRGSIRRKNLNLA